MVQEWWQRIGLVDGLALLLLLWFFIRGVWKGLVWQVAGLLAVIGGLVAANQLAPRVAPTMRRLFSGLTEENSLDLIAAYFVIFFLVLIVVWVIARFAKSMLDRLKLSSYDRVLGGVFGVAKAAALIVVVVSLLSTFDNAELKDRLARAKTGQYAEAAIERGEALFPAPVVERVRQTMTRVVEVLPGHEREDAEAVGPGAWPKRKFNGSGDRPKQPRPKSPPDRK